MKHKHFFFVVPLWIFLCSYFAFHQTLWIDETYTLLFTSGYTREYAKEFVQSHSGQVLSFSEVRSRLFTPAPGDVLDGLKTVTRVFIEDDSQHVPLYYLVTYLLRARAGMGVTELRILNLFFFALAIIAFVMILGRNYWLVVFGTALSPMLLRQVLQVREYALVIALLAWAFFFFNRFVRKGSIGAFLAHLVLLMLSALTSVFSLLYFPAFWLDLVLRNRKSWKASAWQTLSYGVAAVPCILWFLLYFPFGVNDGKDASGWVSEIGSDYVRRLWLFMGSFGRNILDPGYYSSISYYLGFPLFLLALIGAFYLLKKEKRSPWRPLVFLFASPFLVMFFTDLYKGWALLSINRFWLFGWAVAFLLALLYLSHKISERKRIFLFGLIFVVQIASIVTSARLPEEYQQLSPNSLPTVRKWSQEKGAVLVVGVPGAITGPLAVPADPKLRGNLLMLAEKQPVPQEALKSFQHFILCRPDHWLVEKFREFDLQEQHPEKELWIFSR